MEDVCLWTGGWAEPVPALPAPPHVSPALQAGGLWAIQVASRGVPPIDELSNGQTRSLERDLWGVPLVMLHRTDRPVQTVGLAG